MVQTKVWYIPPTRARESLGLPSPRDFPRAKPEGNPEGKANPGSPELLLEVYHSLLFYLHGKKCEGMSLLSYPRCEGMGLLSHLW